MIVAIVRFPLRPGTSAADAKAMFEASKPKFEGLPGLVRKNYLFSAAGPVGGGVYVWESREAAERVYTDEFRRSIAERYGQEPQIEFFESSVFVDNAAG